MTFFVKYFLWVSRRSHCSQCGKALRAQESRQRVGGYPSERQLGRADAARRAVRVQWHARLHGRAALRRQPAAPPHSRALGASFVLVRGQPDVRVRRVGLGHAGAGGRQQRGSGAERG